MLYLYYPIGLSAIRMPKFSTFSLFRWQQLLINSLVGYDTILTNSLVNSPGHGYLYNFQKKSSMISVMGTNHKVLQDLEVCIVNFVFSIC